MFKAKHSNLVVTQYEHLKLSGALALLWGNDDFELPPCHFESFVTGIAVHDRGYGFFDTLAIGEASENEWLDVSRKSFFEECDDQVTDLIVKHHILRLVSTTGHHTPPAIELMKQMQDSMRDSVRAANLDEKLFAFIDRITDFCDRVSFDFCFQNYGMHSINVQQRFEDETLTPLEYCIEPEGLIKISPWPLGVSDYKGYLVGYDATNFPNQLEPELVAYTLAPL